MEKRTIKLLPNQKIFFTSDHHFDHKNVLVFCTNREFSCIKDMDKALISNWNEVVGPEDIVFVLGDFHWSNSNKAIKRVLNKLQGKINIILGNHDDLKGFRELPEHVTLCSDITHLWIYPPSPEEDTQPVRVVLSHYPLMSWSGRSQGVLNLFGHIHSHELRDKEEFDQSLPLWPEQYDVGVDNNNLYPVELFDIINKLKL